MESRMTRKCHVRFGGEDEETRSLQSEKVRLVLTLHLVMFPTAIFFEIEPSFVRRTTA